MPLFGKAAGFITGPLFALPLAAADGFSLLTVVVSLLGGGAGVSLVNAWHRRRTGEGPSSAAESLSQAARLLGETGEKLVEPLSRQLEAATSENIKHLDRIAELERKLTEKTEHNGALAMKLADAAADNVRLQTTSSSERHELQSENAALKAKNAHCELIVADRDEEIRSLKIQLGCADDRRTP